MPAGLTPKQVPTHSADRGAAADIATMAPTQWQLLL